MNKMKNFKVFLLFLQYIYFIEIINYIIKISLKNEISFLNNNKFYIYTVKRLKINHG